MAVHVLATSGTAAVYEATDWDIDDRDRALAIYGADSTGQPYVMAVYAPGAWQVVTRDTPPVEPAQ